MWNPFTRRLELAVNETPTPAVRHPVGFGKHDLEAETSLAD